MEILDKQAIGFHTLVQMILEHGVLNVGFAIETEIDARRAIKEYLDDIESGFDGIITLGNGDRIKCLEPELNYELIGAKPSTIEDTQGEGDGPGEEQAAPEEVAEEVAPETAQEEEAVEPPTLIEERGVLISHQKVMSLIRQHGYRNNGRTVKPSGSSQVSRGFSYLKDRDFLILGEQRGLLRSFYDEDDEKFTFRFEENQQVEEVPLTEEQERVKLTSVLVQMETMFNMGVKPPDEDDEDEDEDDEFDREVIIRRAAASVAITPKAIYEFVRSKLTTVQANELTERLFKLTTLVKTCDRLGQTAVYEDLALQLAAVMKEQAAAVAGYNIKIPVDTVKYFVDFVDERTIKYTGLDKFPRVIPVQPAAKIQDAKNLGIFDTFHILFVDYTGQAEIKTNQQKIRERDPIVFGAFDFLPGMLFYITDWIDEYCDLTLEQMVNALKKDDPEFQLNEVQTIDQAYIDSVIDDVNRRHLRLKITNPRNYKRLIEKEEEEREEREAKAAEQRLELEKQLPERKEDPKTWIMNLLNGLGALLR